MIETLVAVMAVGGLGLAVAYLVASSSRRRRYPDPRLRPRTGRPPSWPTGARSGRFESDYDLDSGEDLSDRLLRMADRYDHSGDTASANAAREAASRAAQASDPAEAHRAASDYLTSVDAAGVSSLLGSSDFAQSPSEASSSETSGGGSDPADGGSSFGSDNS